MSHYESSPTLASLPTPACQRPQVSFVSNPIHDAIRSTRNPPEKLGAIDKAIQAGWDVNSPDEVCHGLESDESCELVLHGSQQPNLRAVSVFAGGAHPTAAYSQQW